MAKIVPRDGPPIVGEYLKVRQAEARLVKLQEFGGTILSDAMQLRYVRNVAYKLTDKFFYNSRDLVIYQDMVRMYQLLLVCAPILQKLPLSTRFDWHNGHILSWFRRFSGGSVKRCFYAPYQFPRELDTAKMVRHLRTHFRITDRGFIQEAVELYECYYGCTTVCGKLAAKMFDPIMLAPLQPGFALRVGTTFHRLEKSGFPGCVNLKQDKAIILDYCFSLVSGKKRRPAEVMLTTACLRTFKEKAKSVIDSDDSLSKKFGALSSLIAAFTPVTMFAYSAQPQILELRNHLRSKLRMVPLTENMDFRPLPNILHNAFLQKSSTRLHFPQPNFFYSPAMVGEKQFMVYLSPYREEGYS